MSDRAKSRRPDHPIFCMMLVLLVWLPVPWGSHLPWAESLLIAAVFALLSIWLILAAAGLVDFDTRNCGRLLGPMLLWAVWIAWVSGQIVQLDPAKLSEYSPQADKLHQIAAAAGITTPYTISIGKGATSEALILTLGYFGIYWLVILTCWRQPERLRWVLGALVISGTLQALYGSLMTLSGIEYGFLAKKTYYTGVATGTFVNRNHLAGYLELTAAAGIGLILADLLPSRATSSWRQRFGDFISLLLSNKLRVRVALTIMAIGIVLTRSRMGNSAFFVSLCICGLGYVLLRERHLTVKALVLFTSLLAIDLMIVGNWFGLEKVVSRIESTDVSTESRTQLYDELPAVVMAYAQTGSGLGTFAQAYAPFRSPAMREYMDHAHNDYLEFTIEAGLPGFFLLMMFVGAHAVHALHVILRRQSRLPPAVCFSCLMALVAYAIHATVEFNLQIPANAATLIAMLALCACCSSTSRRTKAFLNQ